MRRPTDAQKSQAMFRLGRFVFQLKRVGLVRVDTTRFDASLEYTRKLLAAGAGLEDGYAGLIAVRSVEALETAFVPGERDARFSVHVELSPRGPLVWPRRRQKALTSRVGIIDAVSGQVVRTLQTDTVPIEGLEPGEVYQHEIEVAWDGLDDDGEPVELDRSFYVAVFPEAEVMGGAPLPLPWPPQQTFQPVDIAGTIIVQPIPKYLVGSQTDRCNATPPGSHGFPDCDRPGVVCFVEGVSYLPTGDDEYGYEVVFCEPGTVDQFLAPPYYYHCAEAVDSNEYYAQGWDGHQGAQATFRITRWELPPYVEVERHMFQLTGPNEEFPWDINRRHEVYSVPLGHDAAVFVEVLRYLPAGAKKLQWAARAVAGKNLIGVAARTIGGNYDSVVTIRWTILHWPARHSSTYLQYFERIARANNQSHGSCSALPRLIATPTMYSGNSKMELYGAFMWWFDYYALQKPLNVLSNIGYLAWDGRAEAQTEEPEDEFVEDFYLFTEAMDEALQRIMSYRTGINSDNDISMDVEVTEHEGGRCHFLSVFDGNSLSLGEETVWMLHLFND